MEDELRVRIVTESDIVTARQHGRALAEEIGFNGSDLTIIATAISEIARNIVQYAGTGEVIIKRAGENSDGGITVIAKDRGPGIADIGRAMIDGFTTGAGLGLGLPGAKRLMDEFSITSVSGRGTTVTMTKWLHADNGRWRQTGR